jgi:hypothetical protein
VSSREQASGKQLWALNERGLLALALRRSGGATVDKATAWTLLAELHRLAGECLMPAEAGTEAGHVKRES